jgi:hypothetical protein
MGVQLDFMPVIVDQLGDWLHRVVLEIKTVRRLDEEGRNDVMLAESFQLKPSPSERPFTLHQTTGSAIGSRVESPKAPPMLNSVSMVMQTRVRMGGRM